MGAMISMPNRALEYFISCDKWLTKLKYHKFLNVILNRSAWVKGFLNKIQI